MAQFASSAELADRLGIELTNAEQARADVLLTLASGLVQKEARQEIEQTEDDTLTRTGTRADRFRLPERPVTEVTSVTLAGVALDTDSWHVEGDEIVKTRVLGSSVFADVPGSYGSLFGTPDQALVIVYTHGYATIPDAVKAVVLEAVVRVWVNPGSVMSERYGSEQIMYAGQGTPTGLLLTTSEKQTIREAFRRGAGSVTLR